ncbi:prostasin-like [Chironomus tepperi]|uniref:prostasin-like n=1 Tax=Chironomus tepperi TaxID=113505 RepID=UPI00391F865B
MKILIFIILTILSSFGSTQNCGRVKVGTSFTVGSEFATKGQFPWLAPLFYDNNDKFFCGSTIISKQHLLSASHCFKNKGNHDITKPDNVYSLLGIYDLTKSSESGVVKAQVSSIKLHSDWNSQTETYDADIAILRLTNAIIFTNYIQPACLPSPSMNVFEIDGTVVGYGLSDDTKGEHEMRPKYVKISSITQEDCLIGRDVIARISSKRMFCAGNVGKNPCRGDSGGGFHVKLGSSYFVVGIISSAVYGECRLNEFVLFTNVPKYISWINEEIGDISNNDDTKLIPEPLQCKFYYNSDDDRYECLSENTFTSTASNVRISSIDGSFTDGNSYNDVDTINIKASKVTYIPDFAVANQQFPNFRKLYIVLCGLKYIERSKLSKLTQLRVLNFYGNEIEHLNEDVFDDLINLEVLAFVENKIKILPQKLLWNLRNLKEIWSYNNPIEAIPIRFFKGNKKLLKAWMGYSKIKQIDVNFKSLPNLNLLDLRENECINEQACSTCALSVADLQDKIEKQCYAGR